MDLDLAEHFKNSRFDTLVFYSDRYSVKNVNAKTFAVQCGRDFAAPPTEILSISEIKTILFESFSNLNVPLIFTMLSEMPNLENLHFYHSGVKSLPPEIGKMKKLRSLTLEWDVSGSIKSWEMDAVPPEFGDLENLRELNLIHCSSFRKGFPAESLDLQNLKILKFIDDYRTLPENTEFLPNLQHLYLSISKINLPEIEAVLKEWNTVKTVTIKNNFQRFRELFAKYPQIEFINDGQKFSEELARFWDEPEKLPVVSEFLSKERTEKEKTQYAYLVLKKHFVRGNVALQKEDVPYYWGVFAIIFNSSIQAFVRNGEHTEMLKNLFVEMIDVCLAFSDNSHKFFSLVEGFIKYSQSHSLIVKLLPQKALDLFGEFNKFLESNYEADLERQNQMGY